MKGGLVAWICNSLFSTIFGGKDRFRLGSGRLDELRQYFQHPPSDCYPVPFWFWNDAVSAVEIDRQLLLMKSAGVSEFIIHPREGLTVEFLSQQWFELVGYAVKKAAELDMKVWIYDDLNCPSGNTAGKPELNIFDMRAKYLMLESTILRGPGSVSIKLPGSEAGFELVRAGAASIDSMGSSGDRQHLYWSPLELTACGPSVSSVDDSGGIQAELVSDGPVKYLRFFAPDGLWEVGAFIRGISSVPALYSTTVYLIDPLSPAAVEKLIELVYERYRSTAGSEFGRTVRGFFIDEPGLYNNVMTDCWGGQAERGTIAWTDEFPEFFLEEYGYSLLDNLFDLWKGRRFPDPDCKTVRDFHSLVSKLFSSGYLGRIRDWCTSNGLELMGHSLAEENLAENARNFGSFFESAGKFTIPGCDQVGPDPDSRSTSVGRLVSSVSELRGNRRSMAELFGLQGWAMTPFQAKGIVDKMVLGGVNLIVPHAFFYSVAGERMKDCPPSLFFQNAWWCYFRQFSEYTARLCLLTSRCKVRAKIGVYYPESVLFGLLNPWDSETARETAERIWEITDWLSDNYFGFVFINRQSLEDVELDLDGLIVPLWWLVPGPEKAFLSQICARRRIHLFGDNGDSGWSCELRTTIEADATVEEGQGSGNLREGIRIPGCSILTPDTPELYRQEDMRARRPKLRISRLWSGSPKYDVYVLHCESRSAVSPHSVSTGADFRYDVTFPVTGHPELWDPETGNHYEIRPEMLIGTSGGNRTRLSLLLTEGRTVVVVFDRSLSMGGGDGQTMAQNRDNWAGAFKSYTEALARRVDGLWKLEVSGQVRVAPLGSWFSIDPSFSGTGTYTRMIEIDQDELETSRFLLDLGTVYHVAEVHINNRNVGTRLWPPYVFDVTGHLKPGENTIEVRVTNTSANKYGSGWEASGLIGPVNIVIMRR